jgi:hypothetical protein
VVCNAGWGLPLDMDTCSQILGECGFLPTGPVGLVNFCGIPDDLNAEELKCFFGKRARGWGFRVAQNRTAVSGKTRWRIFNDV